MAIDCNPFTDPCSPRIYENNERSFWAGVLRMLWQLGQAVNPSTAGKEVEYQELETMDAATLDGTYRELIALEPDTKVVIIDNQTDGDILISMDAGTTDHFFLRADNILSLDLAGSGLKMTGSVYIMDAATAATTGDVYAYAYK